LQLAYTNDIQSLIPLLKDADEDIDRLAEIVADTANSSYFIMDAETCLGAIVLHWHPHESEIIYLAITDSYRGKGYGKAAIALIESEARNHATESLIVGTANSSIDNIAFYQKCGFRIDAVRKDYFRYLATPVYEFGIQMRDMLLLRLEIPKRDESL
jgi:ribosomal protein S18 acetylase RimI-like enzyme